MGKAAVAPSLTTPNELLLAGAHEYPQALAALNEFVRSTKTMVQEAVESELPYLSKAMGVNISKNLKLRLKPTARIGVAGTDGVNAKIGFAIWGDPDWRQYFYVSWNEDLGKQDLVSLSVTLKFMRDSQSSVAATAKSKLEAAKSKQKAKLYYQIDADAKEVYLWRDIPQKDLESLSSMMREMLRVWADTWRAAGGVKPLLTK
jgi:hypothetical protein